MDIHLYKSINYSLLYLVIPWLPLGYNYFFLFKVYNLFVPNHGILIFIFEILLTFYFYQKQAKIDCGKNYLKKYVNL